MSCGKASPEKHWWEKPFCMIQTNFREIDMAGIDAEKFADSIADLNGTAVMLNAGGIIASYDTEIPEHLKSPFLTGDTFGDLAAACHRRGIRVVARMDFSKVRCEMFLKHPEYAYRTAAGEIINYNGNVTCCPSGDYQRKIAPLIVKEVCERFPIDGMYFNMSGFKTSDYSYRKYGYCRCENCKKLFREFAGEELPDEIPEDSPLFDTYMRFTEKVSGENRERVYRTIKGVNPEIAVDKRDFYRIEANMDFERKGPHWQYMSSCNSRIIRTTYDMAPSNTSVDFLGFFYRHTAPSPYLQNLRILQNIANYGNPDYYVIGRLDDHRDRSAFPFVREAFAYYQRNRDLYEDMRIKADVLLIRNFKVHAEGEGMGTGGEGLGWVRMLTESHIPFNEAGFDVLKRDPQLIFKYKAVILCGYQQFTQETADLFDRYAADGGTLLLVGNTGLKMAEEAACCAGSGDVSGSAAECAAGRSPGGAGFPLKSAGIKRLIAHRDDMLSAMLEVTEEEKTGFPSFADRDYVIVGAEYTEYEFEDDSEGLLRLVPPQPFGPPELCYTFEKTGFFGAYIHRFGKGSVVTVPFLPGLIYHREGFDNLFRFMHDLILTYTPAESVEAEPFTEMVEVTLGESMDGSRMMVHLINATGHFGRSFMKPVPVFDIKLKIPVRRGVHGVQIRALSHGVRAQALSHGVRPHDSHPIPFEYKDGYLYLTVDRLDDFACLVIE